MSNNTFGNYILRTSKVFDEIDNAENKEYVALRKLSDAQIACDDFGKGQITKEEFWLYVEALLMCSDIIRTALIYSSELSTNKQPYSWLDLNKLFNDIGYAKRELEKQCCRECSDLAAKKLGEHLEKIEIIRRSSAEQKGEV